MSWKHKNRNRNAEADAFEDLLVFGYSCHVFVDSERHEEHNAGSHLIPHPHADGDVDEEATPLKIDR